MKIHNSKFIIQNSVSGQALITLLIFIVVAVTVATAAVTMTIVNSVSTSKVESGNVAYSIAESGAENALIRLLRNPFYTGETLPVGDGTATITVTGTNPKTITSVGSVGNFERTIQLQIGYTDNIMSVVSWEEIE